MPFPLGAVLAGDPIGHFQEERRKSAKSFQDQLDQEASGLFGKTLQEMFQSAVPGAGPVPGGVAPVPGVGAAGVQQPTAAPRPGGAPGAAPGQPPMSGAAPAPGAAAPGAGPPGGILRGGREQLMGLSPTADVGKSPGGTERGGQASDAAAPQAQGPLTLQQVIQSVVKSAGPKANPAVIAAAVQKFMPLMNAQSQQQAREMMLQLREQTVQQGWSRLSEMRDRDDLRRQEDEQRQKRWEKDDSARAQRLQATLGRFDAAVRTSSINEARQALAEFDKLIGERTTMAAQLGIQFPPEEVNAMMQKRKELSDRVNAMRAQDRPATFNQRFAPPDSGIGPQPAAPGGGQRVPYAPPQ